MPINPLDVVVPGAGLLGTAINAAAQGANNRKSRKWNEKMYAQQRDDNVQQWHMQNAYNSPGEQMKRLEQAGLNPNLVYGTGSATQNASPIDNASVPTWSPRAPQIEVAPAIASHFDIRLKQAQYDNMKAQNTVLTNEALLKIAQIASINQGTDRTAIQTDLAKATYGNTLEMSNESLRQMQLGTQMKSTDAQYKEGITSAEYEEKRGRAEKIWQDLQEQKLRMKGMSQDQILKQFEIDLRKNGINPNDPMYMRIIGQIISDKVNLKSILK